MSRRITAALARAVAVAAVLACRTVEAGQAAAPTKPPAHRTSPAPAPASAAPTAADRAARDARAALERGDAAKALELVAPVIAKEPAHPLAAAVKVDALLGLGERTRALDAYDAWFNVVGAEDSALLTRIAVAELEALQAEPLLIDALVALSTQRGPRGTRARTQLTEFATADPPSSRSWPAIVALCRLGDATAARRAAQAYRESTGSGRVTALEAVIAAGGPAPSRSCAMPSASAMRWCSRRRRMARPALKLKACADLQQVTKTGEMFARFTAAVALAHLGASGGETLLEAGATSPAQDARPASPERGAR